MTDYYAASDIRIDDDVIERGEKVTGNDLKTDGVKASDALEHFVSIGSVLPAEEFFRAFPEFAVRDDSEGEAVLENARNEAEAILQQARVEAEKIRTDAETEAEKTTAAAAGKASEDTKSAGDGQKTTQK